MKNFSTYIIYLILIASILYTGGRFLLEKYQMYYTGFPYIIGMFAGVVLLMHYFLVIKRSNSPKIDARVLLLALTIKFLVLIVIFAIGLFMYKSVAKGYGISFLTAYFVFTTFEVYNLVKK